MLWCVWRVKANSESILFPTASHMGSDIEVRPPGLQGKHLYWIGLNTFSFFSLFLRRGGGQGSLCCPDWPRARHIAQAGFELIETRENTYLSINIFWYNISRLHIRKQKTGYLKAQIINSVLAFNTIFFSPWETVVWNLWPSCLSSGINYCT